MRALLLTAALLAQAPARQIETPSIRVRLHQPNGGTQIVSLPLETYVARVLAGEASHDSPPEALDALAIAVRTFAVANRGRHAVDGFDMCDGTHCQVVRAATPTTDAAAARTAGRILLYRGAPASIYYTASCGGRTETPSGVWPGAVDPPYLPSAVDDACGGRPAWHAELGDAELVRALEAAGFRGRLRAMRVAARDRSGRVSRLTLEGLSPGEISGQDLRVAVDRALGSPRLQSTAFELTRISGAYRFDGHGFGHGVGLCVVGSVRLAAAGQPAEAILARYFPGLDVGAAGGSRMRTASAPPPARAVATGVALDLPEGDEGERAALEALTVQARDDLARTLDVPAPPRIAIRVHPTIEAFERATGRSWFVSGAVVGGELHLIPLAALRERGMLARTVRHEVVHLLADETLAKRSTWVREGAAAYFAEPHDETALTGRISCPADADLDRPVSMGALASAYARARACFARELARGRSWKEIR